jgi:hypothetical protein
MKKILGAIFVTILVFPKLVSADIVMDLFNPIKTYILLPLLGIFFTLAMLYFIWGVVRYMWNAGNAEVRKTGQRHMIYGVVGMAIMLSVYGIMYFILGTVRSFGDGLHYGPDGTRQDQPVADPQTLDSLRDSGTVN